MALKKKSATVKDFIANKATEQVELTIEQKEAALKAEKQRKRFEEKHEFDRHYEGLCNKFRMRKSVRLVWDAGQNPMWEETTIVLE